MRLFPRYNKRKKELYAGYNVEAVERSNNNGLQEGRKTKYAELITVPILACTKVFNKAYL